MLVIERESLKNIKFLNSGRAIDQKIDLLCEGGPVCAAVAYWGNGLPEDRLPEGSRIVCDLNSTGCNPLAIERLFKKGVYEIRYLDHLHAKVVLGAEGAVVSSANFSRNGLYGEDLSSTFNKEAGIFVSKTVDVDALKDIQAWFDELWKGSQEATQPVISEAIEKYKRLQKWKIAQADLHSLDASVLEGRITAGNRYRSVRRSVFEKLGIALTKGEAATRAIHGVLLLMGLNNLYNREHSCLTIEHVIEDIRGPKHGHNVLEILRKIEMNPELLHQSKVMKSAATSLIRLLEAER